MWNTQGPPYLWSTGNTAIPLSWKFLRTIQNTMKMVQRGPQSVCTAFLQINHAQELVSQAVKWKKMMDAHETETVFSGEKINFW